MGKWKALIALMTALCGCAAAAIRSESWEFVQSAGGLRVDAPLKDQQGWVLPLEVDISGLQTVTEPPTTLNSGLTCERVEAMRDGSRIYLTVVTGVPRPGHASSRCTTAALGSLPEGTYQVYYRGPGQAPQFLREIGLGP